jgi:hypothetical protein
VCGEPEVLKTGRLAALVRAGRLSQGAVGVEEELEPVDPDGGTCVACRNVEFGDRDGPGRCEDVGIDFAVVVRIAAQPCGIDDLDAEDVCALTTVAREVEDGKTGLVLHVRRSDLTTGCVDGRVEVERRRPGAVIVTVGTPGDIQVESAAPTGPVA